MAEKSFKYVIVGGGVAAVSFSIIGSRTFPSSISFSRSDSFLSFYPFSEANSKVLFEYWTVDDILVCVLEPVVFDFE